jgi:hypothetical protein
MKLTQAKEDFCTAYFFNDNEFHRNPYKQSPILVSLILEKKKYQVDRLLYVGWALKNLSRDPL